MTSTLHLRDCVTVKLFGGLGNQLFQYACGRAVTMALDVPLLLDTRWYLDNTDRAFLLPNFAHAGTVLPPGLRPAHEMPRAFGALRARLDTCRGLYIRERQNGPDPRIAKARKGAYIEGYWQVSDYFDPIADTLRKDLVMRTPPTGPNRVALDLIEATPCCAVHVRRGDYVEHKKAVATYARCTPDYYARAARLICDRTEEPLTFVVFSDDPEWTRRNIVLPAETVYMDHNDGDRGHEDMRLMAACRHAIIANSTFSWWGAWLIGAADKIVVSPDTWYIDPRLTNEWILPKAWVTMPV